MSGSTPPPKAPRPGPGMFKGRPAAAKPTGSPAAATPPPARPGRAQQPAATTAPQDRRPQGRQGSAATQPQVPGHEFFVNPYNFVPLHTRRDAVQDGAPPPQGVWHEGLYSGHLTVHLTTETPLLAVRRVRLATTESPALLTVRTAPDGKPAVNGSAIKGMLRSLFEQATGSRLGVFSHDDVLSYRRSADDARWLKLAKVVRSEGELELQVFEGLRPNRWDPFAPVWVEHGHATKVPFGIEVFMRLRLYKKDRRKAWFPSTLMGNRVRAEGPDYLSAPSDWDLVNSGALIVRAKVHNTGHTIGGKKFERVFIEEVLQAEDASSSLADLLVTSRHKASGQRWEKLRAKWRDQIDSMFGEAGTDGRGNKLAVAPYAGDKVTRNRWKQLSPGQTLFADVDTDNGTILGMYPGMITREMREHAPRDLVPPRFRPAETASEMSPADRLFGWVASKAVKGPSAYRGLLAVGGVRCLTEDPIARFPAPVRLAVLEKPKETQFRFYTRAKTTDPTQQPAALDRVPVSEGFNPKRHVIAGHKVYPHHGVPEDWWRTPTHAWEPSDEATGGPSHPTAPNGQPLSYLAANGTKKQVSAELDSWVKPGVEFETTLRVTNLRPDELGALLWILDLEGHHRLGLGKPLGFGSLSVSIDWKRSKIRSQQQLIDRYRGLGEGETQSHEALKTLKAEFDRVFRTTQPAVYLAMVESARGFSGHNPVHYPWVRPARPQAESFHWFVTNERGERDTDQAGPRHALPPLRKGEDSKLPVLEKRKE